jgi:hypothetical protein
VISYSAQTTGFDEAEWAAEQPALLPACLDQRAKLLRAHDVKLAYPETA